MSQQHFPLKKGHNVGSFHTRRTLQFFVEGVCIERVRIERVRIEHVRIKRVRIERVCIDVKF